MSTATTTQTAIGQRLEQICFERNMTFRELCQRLGIHRHTFWAWRTNRRIHASLVTLVMMADQLGVSTDWLLGRTSERRPPA